MVLPNGITGTHHRIVKIETINDCTRLQVHVGSWANEECFQSNKPPIWNEYIDLPILDLYTQTENVILTTPIYSGGVKIADVTELESAKINKWTDIKSFRDRQEYGGFFWDGTVFDSDPQSQSRIQGAVQLAILAQQNNQPFSIDWTLQDNSVRTLSGTDVIAVGQALAAHVQAIHQVGRVLREQIDSATTVQEVKNIAWPL